MFMSKAKKKKTVIQKVEEKVSSAGRIRSRWSHLRRSRIDQASRCQPRSKVGSRPPLLVLAPQTHEPDESQVDCFKVKAPQANGNGKAATPKTRGLPDRRPRRQKAPKAPAKTNTPKAEATTAAKTKSSPKTRDAPKARQGIGFGFPAALCGETCGIKAKVKTPALKTKAQDQDCGDEGEGDRRQVGGHEGEAATATKSTHAKVKAPKTKKAR